LAAALPFPAAWHCQYNAERSASPKGRGGGRVPVFQYKCIHSVLLFYPLAWRYKTPHRVAFVEKLTKLVLSQLPNFWKLWISYVNGSLFSEVCIHF
jgi:hypothetical protein